MTTIDMPARINRLESLLAAGGDSWKWQLRDKNGKWIQMGSKVKWLDRGKSRSGRIVGSPNKGTATVEDDQGNRHQLSTSRLTKDASEPDLTGEPSTTRRQGRASVSEPPENMQRAVSEIADIIREDVAPENRVEAAKAVGEVVAGEIATHLPEETQKLPAIKRVIMRGKAALARLDFFIVKKHRLHKLIENTREIAEEFAAEAIHSAGRVPNATEAFNSLGLPNPIKESLHFLESSAHLVHGWVEAAAHGLQLLGSANGSDMLTTDTMATRISQREAAMTAAGGSSWRWQLRDKNGQWIEMGSEVKWFANGMSRLGKVVGSPQEGQAEVEESKTKRRLRIAANRLTVLAKKIAGDDKGSVTIPGGKEKQQKATAKSGSQPEPDTVPEPEKLRASQDQTPKHVQTGDPETSMPDKQIKELSEGVNWVEPSSDDPKKDGFFKRGFNAIKNLRHPDGSVRPGRVDGTGTEEDPVYVGSDVEKARQALLDGKFIRMRSQQDIISVLTEDFVKEMQKDNPKKTFNMCLVTVPGTNLFCSENKGIIRFWMPQAAGEDEETGVKKDVQPWVEELYERLNMIDPVEEMDAEKLKASQSELDGAQVVGMQKGAKNYIKMTMAAEALRAAGKMDEYEAAIAERDRRADDKKDYDVMSLKVLTEAILTTHDNYIIDGHHRWAALMMVNEWLKAEGMPPVQMKVRKVKQEIGEALVTTNALAKAAGIKPKSAGGADVAPKPDILVNTKANARVEAELPEWQAKVRKEMGADTSEWTAISEAKKIAVRSKATKKAVAASVTPGDFILMPDDTFREVLRVVAETSGGRTFLQRDLDTGDLSLSILASAAPLLLVG